MKKIEAVIKPAIMDEVYAALGTDCQRRTVDQKADHGNRKGVDQELRGKRYRTGLAMTVTTVEGFRTWRHRTEKRNVVSPPRRRIDVVGREWDARAVMDLVGEAARTGTVGGCKVFMTRAKIDLFVSDEHGEKLINAFCTAALNEEKRDGRIFVYPIENGKRIRTKGQRELMTQGTT